MTSLPPTTQAAPGSQTTPEGASGSGLSMSIGLIVLIVLASLCAILGAIYAYIYYTRINPRSARARKYTEPSQPEVEDGEGK